MVKLRKDVKKELLWSVEDIFSTVKDWENEYSRVQNNLDFSCFRGKLSDAETVKKCLDKLYEVSGEIEKLAVYAFMRHDEDAANPEWTSLSAKSDVLEVEFSSQTAFIMPELTSLSEKTLKGFIASPLFKDYDYVLEGILKDKPHVLSEETESTLALGGQVFGGFKDTFGILDNADLPFPKVKLQGKTITVSHGMYGQLMQSGNRELRKKVFKKYYGAYKGLINTITSLYVGNVNKNVFFTKARKYTSCLDKALSSEDVEKSVYDRLLNSVDEALPLLHRYTLARKKALKLDTMHMYDMYVPTVENAELKLSFDEAYALVEKGLSPLGDKYAEYLKRAKAERWIDVEETKGKRSGAYSISVYSIKHPYVLLNYRPTTNNVFTIAHEMGHAIHSCFSNENQPRAKADYRIFVAEVASTVNEVLLLKYLLKASDKTDLRKYLLNYYTDMIKGTLFRQTMFAEFEYRAHELTEKGEPLNREILNSIYLDLNKKYYGKAVVSDPEIAYEWSRIPHFYTAFYVYKYATGIISAITIAENIFANNKNAKENYFKFLSSGGSKSPVELLKIAGVDLTTKEPYEAAMNSFKEALEEFEALII